MTKASKLKAAEDRAAAKTLLGGVLAVLARSYQSHTDAVAQCRDILDDLELAGPPCCSAPPVPPSAASTAPSSQAEKDRKSLRRIAIYKRRLEARMASSSDAPGDPDPASHTRTTPGTPLVATQDSSRDVSLPHVEVADPNPSSSADVAPGLVTPPKAHTRHSNASAHKEHDFGNPVDGMVIRTRPSGPGTKAPKRIDGVSFTRVPPGTPSPPSGILKRNATACVKRTLSAVGQMHRIDSEGVAYIAGLLVMYLEEQWEELVRTWGVEILNQHDASGEWRFRIRG